MRIVHLVQDLASGGLETLVTNIVLGQRRRGDDVRVVCLTAGGATAERLRSEGVDVRVLGVRRVCPRNLWRVRRALLHPRPDVAHLHALPGGTFGRLALIGTRVRALYHVHTMLTLAHDLTPAQKRRDRWLAKLPGVILAISDAVRRDLVEGIGIPGREVNVLSGGVPDLEPLDREKARERLGIGPDSFVLVCPASLTTHKNHETLLAAVAQVKQATLLLAGDGPLRGVIEQRCEKPDLAGRVRLLGYRDDLPVIFAASDAAILLSHPREGLSLAMIEAARAGLPAIVSAVGGLPEVVEEGITGRVVPALDPEAVAAAIEGLVERVPERREMGRKARTRFLERFELNRYLDGLESLYREG